jgi:hypothetical protein
MYSEIGVSIYQQEQGVRPNSLLGSLDRRLRRLDLEL